MNEKIKDILGVNEIQFRQICMIAQGAFAKFLFAKTPEKESIFREIFKTANYETLEKKMKEKYKKVEDEDKLLTEQIKSFKERVECSKDFESDFFEENKKNNTVISIKKDLNQFLEYLNRKNITTLDKLDELVIKEYLVELKAVDLSNSTYNRRLSSIKKFYKYLINNNLKEKGKEILIEGMKNNEKKIEYLFL